MYVFAEICSVYSLGLTGSAVAGDGPQTVNGKMEMDVEGVSPRPEPIPRSQGAGGACQAPSQPPQPQPQPPPLPPQHPAPDEPLGESAGAAEDSDDPEARPSGDKGESKVFALKNHVAILFFTQKSAELTLRCYLRPSLPVLLRSEDGGCVSDFDN
ncbi:hypothetical protein JEQ12_008149 [Ovis aries]|uniref:Uncharacterized protein n=1 Tax=Ovis aries TaxID=9940 RepID=A0A835ZZB4_SHEEP|nr:hypothetical protein JEQ12_008149 [Ovis aries]